MSTGENKRGDNRLFGSKKSKEQSNENCPATKELYDIERERHNKSS